MFDRMPRDGRETQWRTLCESDQPELQPLPDKMDDHFNPVQRYLIVRAVRGDRMMQAATIFISSVLGKKYVQSCVCVCDIFDLKASSSSKDTNEQ